MNSVNIFDPRTWQLQPICGVPQVPFINLGGPKREDTSATTDGESAQVGAIDISDSIPWHRPFFWSPTCQAEAVEALNGVLGLIGCEYSGPGRTSGAAWAQAVSQQQQRTPPRLCLS